MSTIVLRSVKNSPLTNQEVDDNFNNLNTDKIQIGGTYSSGTASGVLFLNSSKVLTTGSALTFDGTNLAVGSATAFGNKLYVAGNLNASGEIRADISTAGTSLVLTGTGSNFQVSHATSGFATLLNSGGGLIFSPANAEQMRLTSTGLGIGTSSPAAKLELSGSTAQNLIVNSTGSSSYMQFANSGGITGYIGSSGGINSGGGNNALGFRSQNEMVFATGGSTERMRIDTVGNVGIGTSSPGAKLTVNAGAVGNVSSFTDGIAQSLLMTTGSGYFGMYNPNYGDIRFRTGNNLGDVLTIKEAGNVGIGTSSPTQKLDVNGNAVFTGGQVILNANTANYLYFKNASKLVFSDTVGNERMTIDAPGNLGLGVTPSAWGLGGAMEFMSGRVISFQGAGGVIASNTYYDGGWKYQSNSYAVKYDQQQNAGIHAWFNAPSGTAGNAISFTQAMTLDASGRLGIGTTSPGTQLHVQGAGGQTVKVTCTSAGTAKLILEGTGGGAGSITSSSAGLYLSADDNSLISFSVNGTERARIDSSGNLLVGTTTSDGYKLQTVGQYAFASKMTGTATNSYSVFWHTATTGDNQFIYFTTEASGTTRGGISYNRAGGLVAYNTTSDYRAKDISGSVTNSGAVIDSTPVYMGKMKGATQERPMFIAHETPDYAHTGVKDAVDADGNPVYQQMDATALVPVMWAEIQSLRKRLAALEAA